MVQIVHACLQQVARPPHGALCSSLFQLSVRIVDKDYTATTQPSFVEVCTTKNIFGSKKQLCLSLDSERYSTLASEVVFFQIAY